MYIARTSRTSVETKQIATRVHSSRGSLCEEIGTPHTVTQVCHNTSTLGNQGYWHTSEEGSLLIRKKRGCLHCLLLINIAYKRYMFWESGSFKTENIAVHIEVLSFFCNNISGCSRAFVISHKKSQILTHVSSAESRFHDITYLFCKGKLPTWAMYFIQS